jgi:hypothetical protein
MAAGDRALRSEVILQAIYCVLFWRVLQLAKNWEAYWVWEGFSPVWPVGWLSRVPYHWGIGAIFALAIGASLLVVLRPASRASRVVFFLGFFQLVALANSFGKMNHPDHLGVWVAALFCFFSFSSVLAATGLFYSMAGMWKVVTWIHGSAGSVSLLSRGGLAHAVALRYAETGSLPVFGDFVITHPNLSTVGVWIATYFQLFALYAAFRPRLHKLWGVALIVFHLGAWLGMGVPFVPTMALLALLWIGSPYAPQKDQNTSPKASGVIPNRATAPEIFTKLTEG